MEPLTESTLAHFNEDTVNTLVDILRKRIIELNLSLPPRTDKDFLAKFLRAKKYDVDAAVRSVEKYYVNIRSNLRLLEGLKSRQFADTFRLNVLRRLKHRFQGKMVCVLTAKNWNTKVASIRDITQAGQFLVEEYLLDPRFQEQGMILIYDLEGMSLTHLRQLSYHEVKYGMKTMCEMLPVRMAGFHCINTPTIFWPIYKIGLTFLSQKLKDRVQLHSKLQSLVETLGADILPQSLGGVVSEEEAWDMNDVENLLTQDTCYDSYWQGVAGRQNPRRLSRKRSSIAMSL